MVTEPTVPPSSSEPIKVPATITIERERVPTRSERDLLGEMDIPSDVYWGIHSLRAIENFPITGITVGRFGELVRALVYVKQAAARANCRLTISRKQKRMRSKRPAS